MNSWHTSNNTFTVIPYLKVKQMTTFHFKTEKDKKPQGCIAQPHNEVTSLLFFKTVHQSLLLFFFFFFFYQCKQKYVQTDLFRQIGQHSEWVTTWLKYSHIYSFPFSSSLCPTVLDVIL